MELSHAFGHALISAEYGPESSLSESNHTFRTTDLAPTRIQFCAGWLTRKACPVARPVKQRPLIFKIVLNNQCEYFAVCAPIHRFATDDNNRDPSRKV